MPDVKMPDGAIVRFPDDMPKEQIRGLIQSKFPDLAPQEDPALPTQEADPSGRPVIGLPEEGVAPVQGRASAPVEPGAPDEVGLSPLLEQGATLGFADEVSGASRAVGQAGRNLFSGDPIGQGVGEAFDRGTDEARARVAQSLEENPIAGRIAEGVGALATAPGGLIKAAGGSLLKRAIAGLAEGGALGALFGAGTAEGGLEERAGGAVQGAVIGGVAGGALPFVAKGVELAAQPLVTAARAAKPKSNAASKLSEALARDGVTPAQAAARLARAQEAGTPQMLAEVAGTNTQRLARSARSVPGAGADKIEKVLTVKQLNQPDRIKATVERTLGGDDALKVADDLIADRSAVANKMYTDAFASAKPVNTAIVKKNIAKRLEKAAGGTRSGLKRVLRELGNKTDIEAIHNVKTQVLDPMIMAARKAGDGAKARELMGVKDQLLMSLRRSSKEYDEARKVFSSSSDSMDALEMGQNFLKKDARVTAKDLAKLADGDKEFYRLGASEAITQKINSAPDGAGVVRRIFGSTTERAKLRAVFPDNRSFREFQVQMAREARGTQTNQFVRGGSQTVDKAAELVDAQGGEVVKDLLRGDPVGAATRAAGTAMNIAKGVTPKTADALADMLTSTDPKVMTEVLKALEARAAAGAQVSRGADAALSAGTRQAVVGSN